MHYYQFNIGDYQSHTNHLDPLEDIIYRRMIDWCYLHESPLPEDVAQIAKKIRMHEQCKRISDVLQEFFVLKNNGYYNKRIVDEVKNYKSLISKKKKAANKRWANKGKALEGDAHALQEQSTSNANHKPINKNHKPLNITPDLIAEQFDKFWNSGLVKIDKKKSLAKFKLKSKGKNLEEFTNMLCADVKKRIAADQFGIDKLHPSTYLNNDRWEDDISDPSTDLTNYNDNYQDPTKVFWT